MRLACLCADQNDALQIGHVRDQRIQMTQGSLNFVSGAAAYARTIGVSEIPGHHVSDGYLVASDTGFLKLISHVTC